MNIKCILGYLSLTLLFSMASCENNDDASLLNNDCIKRSVSPNLVGEKIEFAYAMAIPQQYGSLSEVEVLASIAGAKGTYLDPNSYYTNTSGIDIGVQVAAPSTLSGNSCNTTFIVDTCAATLRYFYEIPEEARGKEVSFTFSVKATNGEMQSYSMGPYKISRMDMVKNLEMVSGDICCLSIADMKVYSYSDIIENASLASRIDMVYAYNSNSVIGSGLYAPTTPPEYLNGVVIPSGATSDTKMVKAWGVKDQQLSGLQWSMFVDDADLVNFSFDQATNFSLQLKAENGIWVETADKKYRAYMFINSVKNEKMVISMKRYTF